MNLKQPNKYGQYIYTSDEVVELLYKDPELQLNKLLVLDTDQFNFAVKSLHLDFIKLRQADKISDISIEEFDKLNQKNWFMPDKYYNMDLESHLLKLCSDPLERERVILELSLYEKFNLTLLLKFLIYIVDTMRENSIVWGVGRGSSVASHILYLIGLHKVNSLKYNLDINEFLR